MGRIGRRVEAAMRGTRMIGLAATALVALAGCGGAAPPAAAPVQTVDLSGLIQVDELNKNLPVEKEEFEAAIAETLQERAPAGVRVVYNPGAPPVQRYSQGGGGNQGSGKEKPALELPIDRTPPPPPGGGTPPPAKQGEGTPPPPPPGTPAKPSPGENAPSPATCGFDPSKAGCENFCAQNPEFQTCKKPAPGTPPPAPVDGRTGPPRIGDPATPPSYLTGKMENCRYAYHVAFFLSCTNVENGNLTEVGCDEPTCGGVQHPKVGDPAPKPPPGMFGTTGELANCRYAKGGIVQCDKVGTGDSVGLSCYLPNPEFTCDRVQESPGTPPAGTPAPAGGGKKPLTVGDAAPTPPPSGGESYGRCKYVTSAGEAGRGYIHCDIIGTGKGKAYACPPEAACNSIQLNPICVANPGACDEFGAPELATLTPFLRGVIDDSFEKVGVEFEPGSATAAVSLAEISIAGVKANVEASQTGEIVSEVEEVSVPTSEPDEDAGDAVGAGEPVVEGEPGEPTEGELPADGTLPEEGVELEGGELPAAPSEAAPAPEAPVTPEPAPPAPASPSEPTE